MSNLICVESLAASLREPEILNGHIDRYIYISSKPLGNEGACGIVQQGDLASDRNAKIIHFDRAEQAFGVSSNGNPAPPEEFIPDGDIGSLIRHFIRSNSAFGPVYITVADSLSGRGVETIRRVLEGKEIEMYCQHGPHSSARGVPYVRKANVVDSTIITWENIAYAAILFFACRYIYYRYWRPPQAPSADIDKIKTSLAGLNKHDVLDIRGALEKARTEHM